MSSQKQRHDNNASVRKKVIESSSSADDDSGSECSNTNDQSKKSNGRDSNGRDSIKRHSYPEQKEKSHNKTKKKQRLENSVVDSNSFRRSSSIDDNEVDTGGSCTKSREVIEIERNRSRKSGSSSITSVAGRSLSISDDNDFESRIINLEKEVSSLKQQLQRNSIANSGPTIVLKEWQKANIGIFVRDEMFKAIKFIDEKVQTEEGQKIISRALATINMTDYLDHQQLCSTVMSRIKSYMNVHKGHTVHNIRQAALSK
jgi:hypothetical protein